MPIRYVLVAAVLSSSLGCRESGVPAGPVQTGAATAIQAGSPPVLRRLTVAQYHNAVHDLFGPSVVIAQALEPDTEFEGLFSLGAARAALSPRGVELYEQAAFDVAAQVLDDPALRGALVDCKATGVRDDACAGQVLASLARRAFRRPLEAAELGRLVALSGEAAQTLGDFHDGLGYAVAAVLQSPSFLYRSELGHRGEDGILRLGSFELATRTSFLLWNSLPDDLLLDAAAAGRLGTEQGLTDELERMLSDPRAQRGVHAFFYEYLELYALDALSKDTTIFRQMSPDVGSFAREETLRVLDRIVLDERADFRSFLTTRDTFLNRKLAAIYGVPAPSLDGFGPYTFTEDQGRAGFLGQASFLALQAHAVSTSATLRGKFVRSRFLCDPVLPPPVNVETVFPDEVEKLPTLRERVAIHVDNPSCAGCHAKTDPIGLAFETFDGLGGQRTKENGSPIDPSGALDGASFANSAELAQVIHDDPRFGQCVARYLVRYATGALEGAQQEEEIAALGAAFRDADYDLLGLVSALVRSPLFTLVEDAP